MTQPLDPGRLEQLSPFHIRDMENTLRIFLYIAQTSDHPTEKALVTMAFNSVQELLNFYVRQLRRIPDEETPQIRQDIQAREANQERRKDPY